MKKVFLLFIMMVLLSGCAISTPEDIEFEEWEMFGALQNGRSARIGNTGASCLVSAVFIENQAVLCSTSQRI